MILDVARMPPVDEGAFAVRVIEFDLRFGIANYKTQAYLSQWERYRICLFSLPVRCARGEPNHGSPRQCTVYTVHWRFSRPQNPQ